MKTYIIEREYENKIKVTVEDEVRARIIRAGAYNDKPNGVVFETLSGKWDDDANLLACFNNISKVYLEGMDIKEEVYVREEKDNTPVESTVEWKTLDSKKS